jgi:F-type H+-transporting ATPase subunit b
VVVALWTSPLLAQDHAPVEHAADDKAGVLPSVAQGIVPMIVSLLVFGIVYAILAKFVFPKINKGLQDRGDKIREEIESAEQARLQAKDALEQYQQSLAQARAEAQKMLEQAKAQTLALSADLKAKAEVELGQLRERATRDIETAKRAALNEIYAEASNLATHIATKILRREVRPTDNQAIVDESLRQLQSTSN